MFPEKQHKQEEEVAQQQTIRFWTNYGTGQVGTLGLFSSENNIFLEDTEPFPFACAAGATLWTFVRAPVKREGRECYEGE